MKTREIMMNERQYWLQNLIKISRPVLENLAAKRLKAVMPVGGNGQQRYSRIEFTYLEAFGRTLDGMAPWLECTRLDPKEESLRQSFAILARKAMDAATDPDSPDFLNFSYEYQPIVDAAFLAHAILRAPRELWQLLEPRVQANLIKCMKATRSRKPFFCNWLLFSAIIETFLSKVGEDWDPMRVDYALRQHEQWYCGDGVYGDGPEFHWDYYNSFVIQPMLVEIIECIGKTDPEWEKLKAPIIQRAKRYAEILERLIAPDGSFPPIGRSLTYRFGAFQHLAQMALQKMLPSTLTPPQVRSALTAIIKRIMEVPGNFDENGWLTVGFCGPQDSLGETYIATGSLYLCTTVFLPLGLSPKDEFWKGTACDWTSRKIWSGQNMPGDHAF